MTTIDIKEQLVNLLKNDSDIHSVIKKILLDTENIKVINTSTLEINTLDDKLTDKESQENTNAAEEKNKKLNDTILQLNNSCSILQEELTKEKNMLETIKKLLGLKKEDNKTLNEKILSLEIKISQEKTLQYSLQDTINSHEDKLKEYSALFTEEIKTYALFQALSNKTKISLKGIFKDDSMAGFIACGVQEKNIDSLWEYIKNEVMEENNADLENLGAIFDFLFLRFTLASPIYERQRVNTHEEFDAKQHIKHSSSHNVSGEIQSIILSGWINNKTNRVVKQSIVII